MRERKFEIDDEVYFEGTRYWVCGINLKAGYDMDLWEYMVGKQLYNDAPPYGSRVDKETKGWLRDDQLRTAEQQRVAVEQELATLIEKKQKELDDLKARQKEHSNE